MLYVTTLETVNRLPGGLTAKDRVVLYYPEGASCPVEFFLTLIRSKPVIDAVCVSGRDELLVCFGALLSTVRECVVLDGDIPVPGAYKDRVVPMPKKNTPGRPRATSKKTSPGKRSKEPSVTKASGNGDASGTKEAIKERNDTKAPEQDAAEALPRPVVTAHKETASDDANASRLASLIGITASDVGFSWPTEMLMNRIAQCAEDSDTPEDFERAVCSLRNGKKIWAAISPRKNEVYALCREGENRDTQAM